MRCVIWSIFCGVEEVDVYPRPTVVFNTFYVTSSITTTHNNFHPNRATQRNLFVSAKDACGSENMDLCNSFGDIKLS